MNQIKTLRNMSATRRGWYDIQNKAVGPTQLMIYDDIGNYGITANDFIDDLRKVSGDLEIHMNTQGGNVFDGITIYNALSQRQGNVSVIIDGLAASIGSVIAMAASEGQLKIAQNASIMIHEAHAVEVGNSAEMTKMAERLDKTSDNIASIYEARTGIPASEWRTAMKNETWYSASEAVQAGLADQVLPGRQLSNHISNQSPALTNADVDESSWDGSAAMSAAAQSDDPAEAYKAICAGRKDGDPDLQSSWALPHHSHPGDGPNESGVKNALARLPQTQGLTNEAAARAHLQAHMKEINPDYGSDDSIFYQIQATLKEVIV